MFQPQLHRNGFVAAANLLVLIFHATVRDVRKSDGNAILGLIRNVLTMVVMLAAFYALFSLLGIKSAAIRGDFMLYLMSGIFLFMTHIKALGAVSSTGGPNEGMMQHAPMNTFVVVISAALGTLYIQILSISTILFLYHVFLNPIVIDQPLGALGIFILAWFTGVGVGMIFLAIQPWFPKFSQLATRIYQRANMITSGKMFVANQLPGWMLALFDWNPLFHCIDQMRGYVFINYNPVNSSITYPIKVTVVLIMIGLMGEFYARKNLSVSYGRGK